MPNPAPDNSICVIRSHGASVDAIENIRKMGYEVVDLTCPDVKKVQNTAARLAFEGYFLIILGLKVHPEVIAIEQNSRKYARAEDSVLVVKSVDDLMQYEDLIKKQKKVGVVIQTTQKLEFLKGAIDYLLGITKELKIMNTICHSTSLRQNEAKKVAQESDLAVVAGSKKSANTTHLAEILKNITKTIHIEDDTELEKYTDAIKNAQNIVITAGASTPDYIIKNIETKLKTI